jgi:hypothetical protein
LPQTTCIYAKRTNMTVNKKIAATKSVSNRFLDR